MRLDKRTGLWVDTGVEHVVKQEKEQVKQKYHDKDLTKLTKAESDGLLIKIAKDLGYLS